MSRRRDLILFADGLLDPDAELELMERLEADPDLRARRAAIDPTPDPTPQRAASRWQMPPPGLSWKAGRLEPRPLMVMNRHRVLTAGRRFQLCLSGVPDPEQRHVVVLRRLPGEDWAVISPTHPGQQVPLTRLQQADDGAWEINLMASGPPGLQRWTIALPRTDLPIDWPQPPDTRWAALRAAIARGDVPTATTQITVHAR